MTNKTASITQARADFKDLEKRGWNFSDIYQDVSNAQGISFADAESWEKENYHVIIDVEADGSTYYQPCHNIHGRAGDRQETGDDAQTIRDLAEMYDAAQLWEVFTTADEV